MDGVLRPEALPPGVTDSDPGWKPLERVRPKPSLKGKSVSSIASIAVKKAAYAEAMSKKPKTVHELREAAVPGEPCLNIVDDGSGPRPCGKPSVRDAWDESKFRRGSRARGTPVRAPLLQRHPLCQEHAAFLMANGF